MKQTIAPQHGNSLLQYAVSTLNPDIFLHPVWIRFGWEQISEFPYIATDLISAAESLQTKDPSGACQILLLSAIYQNHNGQPFHAMKTIQQAVALAEQSKLSRELLWALWGACAIYVQQESYTRADESLVDLQAALNQQDEWILADFADVLRQSFQRRTTGEQKYSGSPDDRFSRDILAFTFDWLQHWGGAALTIEPEFELASGFPTTHTTEKSALTQSFFSIQRWQGRWHTLMLAIRGELRLQWIENDQRPARRQFSFWGSFLSSLRVYFSGRKDDLQVIEEEVSQLPVVSVLPPTRANSPSPIKTRKKKPIPRIKEPQKKNNSPQVPTTTPVAVHMLGTFRLTIGDLAVRLPASRVLSMLKYLLFHHKHSVSREVLMDVFWPDAEPETARNSLNVAMHSLRKALRNVIFLPVISFRDGDYGLESNLQVWLDVDEFERCVKAGQRLEARNQLTVAVTEYETAISLYQGDFLAQNSYEEWTVLDRERLRIAYLDILDRLSQIYFGQERYAACIPICQLILTVDHCREDTHCLLMRCYSRQGQNHLALRQYQTCVEALHAELEVNPAPETTQLYNCIRRRDRV